MENLENKVAVVTGGSSGIGKAICLALSDEGCKVAVLSRNRASNLKQETPTDALIKDGLWVYCDLTKSPFLSSQKGGSSGSLTEAIRQVVDKWGRLDILVNNAGVLTLKDFLDHTEEDYDSLIDTNLKGPVFATQIAIKQMLKQTPPGGQIINISSIWGLAPTWTTIYAASKAALVNFSQNIASEFGETIKCNCICPGFIKTELHADYPKTKLSTMRGNILHEIAMHRRGNTSEVAEVVLWLLKSSYVNGATVVVDGGRNARASTGIRFPDWEAPSGSSGMANTDTG